MVIRWEQYSLFPFGVMGIIFMSVSLYAKKCEEHCRSIPQLNKMFVHVMDFFYNFPKRGED
jgi:hypothetical protein